MGSHLRRGSKFDTQLTKGSQSVVRLIESDPLACPATLARALGLSELAARKRLRRLVKQGVLNEVYTVHQDYSGLPAQALVFAKIVSARLRRKQQPGYSDTREFVEFMKSGLPETREWGRFFRSKPGESARVEGVFSVSGGGMGTDIVMLIAGTSEALLRDFVIDLNQPMPSNEESPQFSPAFAPIPDSSVVLTLIFHSTVHALQCLAKRLLT